MNRRTFITTATATVGLAMFTKPAHAATLTLPIRPRVLLVGDSYTEGVGADPRTAGYAYQIADPLGWQLTIDGRGGSGYCNPTTYRAGTFATRINRRYYANSWVAYDLIVLQGSSNDQKYTSTDLAGALNMTIRTVKARYPAAKILMLGPTNPYGNPSTDLLRVNAKVKQYAGYYAIPYLDPIAERWFVPGDGKTYAVPPGQPGDGHPNNAGHRLIAERFVADVRALTAPTG